MSLRAAAISITVVAALAVAGCSASQSSQATKVSATNITFSYLWGGNGPESKALDLVIGDFNKSQSAIHVVGVSSPDFQKQLTSMSSGNGSFDISDNFGSTVGSWAAKGILAPLDASLAENKVNLSDFAPSAMNQMSYQGKIYALPIAVHTQELLYNKDLLSAAGVQPPKTIDEFASAIGKLTKTDAKGKITQLGLGVADAPTVMTLLGQAFGGAWDGTDNKTPSPTDANNIKALDWYTQHVTKKYGASNIAAFRSGLGQYMSAQDPFYLGKEAMVIDGEWQAVNIPKVAPNLHWGVIEIPAFSPQLARTTQVSTSILFIPSNSKHKKEAAAFLAYMMGDKAMTDFTLALGNLPSKISLLTNPAYASIPNFDVWLNNLASPNAKSLASTPYSAQYSTDLGTAFDSVLRGVATPTEAMKSVAKKATSYNAG